MNKEQNQENIQLLPAKPQDVMMLTAFSKWAFETDVQVGAPALAGPPGYKSNQFYSQMNHAKYLYSFFANGIIIGGAVLIPGGNPKGTEVEIGRIFLNPEHFKIGKSREQVSSWAYCPINHSAISHTAIPSR